MRPYILAECTWSGLRTEKYDLAVLPWGATEAHNYHLPYSTDNIETVNIAEMAAANAWGKGAKVIVLPGIPYGVNTGQTDIYLTMNMNPSTQYAILTDILENLSRYGINRFLIVNGHGGNDFKQMLRELGLKYPDMLLATCNWYQAVDKSGIFDHDGDHADEMETSIVMHLAPELVLTLDEAGDGKSKKFNVTALNEKWAWSERKWSKVSDDTGIGNPRLATAEKGRLYLTKVISKVSEFMCELAEADKDNLYS